MRRKTSPAALLLASAVGLVFVLLLASAACRDIEEEKDQPHYSFVLDTPPNGATNVDPRILIHWDTWNGFQLADQDDLYFGTAANPPFFRHFTHQDSGYFRPGPLEPNRTYYWRIAVPGSSAKSPVYSFSVGRDRTLWTYTLPPGQSKYDVNGTPQVIGNRVYQSSEGGLLHCLDAVSGGLLWNFDPTQSTAASPATKEASEKFVYNSGSVYCLDAISGALLWSAAPANSHLGYRSPILLGDRVYTNSNDQISCLDAAMGSEIWSVRRTFCAIMDAAGGKVLILTNTSVYLDGSWSLECLDAVTGATLWSHEYGSQAHPSVLTASDSRAFVGLGNQLFCLDAASGAEIWKYTAAEYAAKPFAFDGRLLMAEGQDRYALLDAGSGSLLWRTSLIETQYQHYTRSNGSPVLVAGSFILADMSGYVYAIDAETGAIRWHYFVSTDMLGIASCDDRVYVTGDDEYLYCLDIKD